MKYVRVWVQLVHCAFSSYASNRIDAGSYFLGKLIRFGFFWLFFISLFHYTDSFAGYTKWETLLFFVTFNLVDVLGQALFRGIYLFRNDIRKGNFDCILVKPLNSLFYILSRLTDILDILFLAPLGVALWYVVIHLPPLPAASFFLYALFLFVGLVIVLGIHVLSAALTIWSMESEGMIWFYRDATAIGRFPPEIFSKPIQFVFTFCLPIIVMVAFPVKMMLGALPLFWAMMGCIIALVFLIGALVSWRVSVRRYSSASS